MLKTIRTFLRDLLFLFIKKIFATDDAKRIIHDSVKNCFSPQIHLDFKILPSNYPELPIYKKEIEKQKEVIFITGRFRSGSTLLWNIFRNVDSCTAYYEPFNERKWFNKKFRGEHVDNSHINVSDYWKEYENLEILDTLYNKNWIKDNLYMDKNSWDPQMLSFINTLIEKTPQNVVMQFNRIDFRLPWIKHYFPQAKIIHIYRNPREQWCSSLKDIKKFSAQASFVNFTSCDHFYLEMWARDLRYHFPFLDASYLQHPYQLFYLIWRLSYVFGVHYGNYSVCYEKLIENFEKELDKIFSLSTMMYDCKIVESLVSKSKKNRWPSYANQEWFQSLELECEKFLYDFFNTKNLEESRELYL